VSTSAADRIVEAAAYLLAQGDHAGAEGLLSQALRLDPQHVRARETLQKLKSSTSPGGLLPAMATPAPNRRPTNPSPAALRPSTWSSRPQVDPPAAPVAKPTTRTPVAPPGGLDLDTVRQAAQRWREGLQTPLPTPDPTAGSPWVEGLPSPVPMASSASAVTALVPAVAPAPEVTLLVVTGPQRGAQLTVGFEPVAVGRGAPALDLSDDPFASPQHAWFALRDGALLVADGGSASGTWLTIQGAHLVAAGEAFSVGQQRLRYLGPLESPSLGGRPELGGPLPAASWRLEHTLVGNRPGRVWLLRGIVTVGREGASLSFDDDHALARQHADLRPSGTGLELVDRSEGLGTWICLAPGAERVVAPGTLVRVGATVLQLAPR
jgi:hypothetical protein